LTAAGAGVAAAAAAPDDTAGDVRLNAEFVCGDAMGWLVTRGAGAEGMDRSRRSFIPLVAGAECLGGAAEDANASKSPILLAGLVVRSWEGTGVDEDLALKKLPPPPNRLDEDVVGGALVLEKLSRPEKGEGFGAGAAAKERVLKASLRPPKEDGCEDG